MCITSVVEGMRNVAGRHGQVEQQDCDTLAHIHLAAVLLPGQPQDAAGGPCVCRNNNLLQLRASCCWLGCDSVNPTARSAGVGHGKPGPRWQELLPWQGEQPRGNTCRRRAHHNPHHHNQHISMTRLGIP